MRPEVRETRGEEFLPHARHCPGVVSEHRCVAGAVLIARVSPHCDHHPEVTDEETEAWEVWGLASDDTVC